MRRFSYKKYILLALGLLMLLSLPPLMIEKVRYKIAACCTPLWKGVRFLKGAKKNSSATESMRLSQENHLLRLEVDRLKGLLKEQSLMKQAWQAVTATVIYREASSWSHFFWIDVGAETNRLLKREVIEKNSPVLFGKAVVGVIDHVGERQSRVRLITDPAMQLSVKALNKQTVVEKSEECYSPKGILQGAAIPLWHQTARSIKGKGFQNNSNARMLVQDVLVTSGMDGVFPMGLKVAIVTKVFPLKEGAHSYDIEAKPLAGNMDELHTVFVIPSLHFDDPLRLK